ncbi:MAG: glycerol-3-phosphate dehydrogenase [Gammaproteobacteria bacterium]|nr:glycerol-3-phosphate dehydrogenase [Gammaproteobacteria bacterium]
MVQEAQSTDLFIVGGGINGCGIARDAAGRGLSVTLAEMNDLGSATSSASTKLFHGGLRYLEYFEFRLVREALEEREVLLKAMPHISWPMRFVLPYHPDMRFESETPTSKLLSLIMPWAKGRRPQWLIRLGLFMYDHLGGRKILPGTLALDLHNTPEGKPLQAQFAKAYEYSDCWVEDSRLVVLNAKDAKARGATILPRHQVISAKRQNGLWHIETKNTENGSVQMHTAKMLVNAGGPWVADVITETARSQPQGKIRLVRGSHIVVKRLYDHDKCYFFQGTDGRIIFAIPYEQDFTLIGTTDADHPDPSVAPVCTDEERDYLLHFANQYFEKNITADDVVWSYSGVRPLFDDGASSASAATRDYTLKVDNTDGVPLLNIFGGKITTYRRLAESALNKIQEHLPKTQQPWTAQAALPGGDLPVDGVDDLVQKVRNHYEFVGYAFATRLVRAYGTEVFSVLGDAKNIADLGEHFGSDLYAREVQWLVDSEFAYCAEDVIWRRTKFGLRIDQNQIKLLESWIANYRK